MRPTLKKALKGLGIAFGALLAVEVLFRVYLLIHGSLGERIAVYREFNAPELDPEVLVEPHPYWVYNASTSLDGVNRYGFTFDDLPLEKPPGTLRIACIGGSTTAGPEAWPYHLEQVLSEEGQKVEVLNFGTPGWTTAESLVAFALMGQHFEPDIVIVHHANNDLAPMMGVDFRPDYAHYRKPLSVSSDELGRLRVKTDLAWAIDHTLTRFSSVYVYAQLWILGEQARKYSLHNLTEQDMEIGAQEDPRAFHSNLRSIAVLAEEGGSEFVLTTMPHRQTNTELWSGKLDMQNDRLVKLANAERWTLIRLHDEAWVEDWFLDPVHLTQEGERYKAEQVAAGLPR